jgi:hypothetical protein
MSNVSNIGGLLAMPLYPIPNLPDSLAREIYAELLTFMVASKSPLLLEPDRRQTDGPHSSPPAYDTAIPDMR